MTRRVKRVAVFEDALGGQVVKALVHPEGQDAQVPQLNHDPAEEQNGQKDPQELIPPVPAGVNGPGIGHGRGS